MQLFTEIDLHMSSRRDLCGFLPDNVLVCHPEGIYAVAGKFYSLNINLI
jgi:hypothetical protein